MGTTKDTNKVQTEIGAWTTLDAAYAQLNSEASQMSASGAKLWRGQNYVYNVDSRGGNFYYGEGRNVFPEGYYLATHVRGYYGTGQEVQDLMSKSNDCMTKAIAR